MVLGKLLVKVKWNLLFSTTCPKHVIGIWQLGWGGVMEVFSTFPFNFGTTTLVLIGWLVGWLVECSHGKGVLRHWGKLV